MAKGRRSAQTRAVRRPLAGAHHSLLSGACVEAPRASRPAGAVAGDGAVRAPCSSVRCSRPQDASKAYRD